MSYKESALLLHEMTQIARQFDADCNAIAVQR